MVDFGSFFVIFGQTSAVFEFFDKEEKVRFVLEFFLKDVGYQRTEKKGVWGAGSKRRAQINSAKIFAPVFTIQTHFFALCVGIFTSKN